MRLDIWLMHHVTWTTTVYHCWRRGLPLQRLWHYQVMNQHMRRMDPVGLTLMQCLDFYTRLSQPSHGGQVIPAVTQTRDL